MNKNGPIVVIEDDADDRELLNSVFTKLHIENEVVFFEEGVDALHYLEDLSVQPFLVLSDINMPKLNGFELRDKIHKNDALKFKCIPYIFMTTATAQHVVMEAYSKSVQGFFIKPNNFNALQNTIKKIVDYWQACTSPNRVSVK